jgi:serine-type D-Ala-D-Ala carboxypeptidase/endopeptidase (penicillin-binding protein 4)
MKQVKFSYSLFILSFFLLTTVSCSLNKQIAKQAYKILLQDTAIRQGQIGICIYESAADKYWYNHDAEKYFIPASNTKLFTLYGGMKYLGDSLNGFWIHETRDSIYFKPNADPTFLLAEFKDQLFFNYLKNSGKKISYVFNANQKFKGLGRGWAWDDYQSDYMAERSQMPVYGNVVTFFSESKKIQSLPSLFLSADYFDEPMMQIPVSDGKFILSRKKAENKFHFKKSNSVFTEQKIPFVTDDLPYMSIRLLEDALQIQKNSIAYDFEKIQNYQFFKTQPSDSLFKPMMHRSDNFFAEQTLLMVSSEKLGYMSDKDIIDTLLKNDLVDITQKPKWIDGSGLSRYNLFTPQSFVYLLNKLKKEFGWERIKNILPTGGEGTLENYFKTEEGFIFAKTGTLNNNCALSGYLITKKGKLLIFSILANNYITGASLVRKPVELFLQKIRSNY